MTKMLPIRLKAEEWQCVEEMIRGRNGGVDLDAGELVRLLLCREYRRRKGLSKPKPGHWQAQFRRGASSWQVLSWLSAETDSDARKLKDGKLSERSFNSKDNGSVKL